jgi:beta-glucosidase
MKNDLSKVISEMTLEEKASLCSGDDFWHLKGIERLDIPRIMVTDGPHGLRKQNTEGDHLGLSNSVKTTCFPTASATASSWDVEMMFEMGTALAEECLQEDVSVLLGPGANIKRSPLCGRNFEYISEDPYLTGKMGAALINGIQSKGVGSSLKHFAANNQEYRRMTTDSIVDERALREIYLAGFEMVIKNSQPWTVMCAYNKVNGTYCSDNKKLLNNILKEEWGHTGLVVTDWGACNDRVQGIKSGMELEMPSSGGINDRKIVEAVKNGELSEKDLDNAVLRILNLIQKSLVAQKPNYKYDVDAHDELARKVSASSAVLLKNKDNLLPIKNGQKIAVIGEFAQNPRYQGSGSSQINPIRLHSAIDELKTREIDFDYYRGYDVLTDSVDQKLIDEAVEGAKQADVAIVYIGLTDDYESEGFDRKHMALPTNHNALIQAVANAYENVVVILQNGAPVEMPWIDKVDAVLECYLGGQAGGLASIDLLYGDVNPSGKLAETFPVKCSDDLATNWFANNKTMVEYRESIYVGYRYYDSANKNVLFPFGHGLSYTTFEYSNLKLDKKKIKDTDTLEISVCVKNTGSMAGAEIVQVYVKDMESSIFRPEKELKGFDKVYLEPGEEKTITMTLDKRSFAYYNTKINDWHVESGDFEILVGSSSRDIVLSEVVTVMGVENVTVPDYSNAIPEYYDIGNVSTISGETFEKLLSRKIDRNQNVKHYTINSTLQDISATFIGKKLYNGMLNKLSAGIDDDKSLRMMKAVINDMPIRSMVLFQSDKFNDKMAEGLLMMINRKPIRGLVKILKNRPKG